MSPHDQNGSIPEQIRFYRQQARPLTAATHDDSGRLSLAELAELFADDSTVTEPDPLPTSHTTATATPPNPISQFADAIAWQMIEQQLPGAVQSSIHRILVNPTSADLVHLLALLQHMGTDLGLMELYAIFGGYRLQAGQSKSPGGTR